MERSIRRRYVLLDGIRGVAAFEIMAYHLWLHGKFFFGSNIFVDLFFVLSGFVLAPQLLLRSKGSSKEFIVKRVLRLWPMLIPAFIILVATEMVPVIHKSLHATSHAPLQYVCAFLLLQIFSGTLIPILTPLWSLSAEWFVNLLSVNFSPRGKNLVVILVFGFGLELIGLYLDNKYQLGWGLIKYLVAIGRAVLGFYAGIYLRISTTKKNKKSSATKFLLALMLCGLEFYLLQFSNYFVVFSAPIFYLLLNQVVRFDETRLPIAVIRLSSYLGKISYGVYVWHEILAKLAIPDFLIKHSPFKIPGFGAPFFRVVCSVILVIIVTEFCIRFFEAPINIWGKKKFAILSNV